MAKLLIHYVEETRRREDATMMLNQQTTEGETALHFAAEITKDQLEYPGEDGDLMNLLIDYGGDVNLHTQITNETVLHYCCRAGLTNDSRVESYQIISVIGGNQNCLAAIVGKIGAGAVQIALNKQTKRGFSPLLEGCAKGHYEVVKILLNHNARVDVFDENGRTSLHLAAEGGHTEVADLLLTHKAFVNSKTKLGFVPHPLTYVACPPPSFLPSPSTWFFQFRVTPLHLAAQQGHLEMVRVLVVKHSASLEAGTLEVPPLLSSFFSDLKEAGCVCSPRRPSTTPPSGASWRSPRSFSPSKPTPRPRTAFAPTRVLTEQLFHFGLAFKKGQTPLHLAAENDYPDVVKLFLKMSSGNLNALTAMDENGFTCAHIAAMKGPIRPLLFVLPIASSHLGCREHASRSRVDDDRQDHGDECQNKGTLHFLG